MIKEFLNDFDTAVVFKHFKTLQLLRWNDVLVTSAFSPMTSVELILHSFFEV